MDYCRASLMDIVRVTGIELKHAPLVYRDDREIVTTAIRSDLNAFKYASYNIQDDKEIVLSVVADNGLLLKYASFNMSGEHDVVLTAVTQNGLALEYACYTRTFDEDIILRATENHGLALKWVSPLMKKEKELMLRIFRGERNLRRKTKMLTFLSPLTKSFVVGYLNWQTISKDGPLPTDVWQHVGSFLY